MQLTPTEIIRLGIEQGHSPDVIAASLEAAGWIRNEWQQADLRDWSADEGCGCPCCLGAQSRADDILNRAHPRPNDVTPAEPLDMMILSEGVNDTVTGHTFRRYVGPEG